MNGSRRDILRLWSCSFDKGLWTRESRREPTKILDSVALRRKGRPTEVEQLEQSDPDYQRARRRHPAIHASKNRRLDRCRDHGIEGFHRYVAMAMVARNIQQLGKILLEIEKGKLNKEALPQGILRDPSK